MRMEDGFGFFLDRKWMEEEDWEWEVMERAALKCPFCGNEDARPYGASNGKKRYAPVIILNVPIKHFTRKARQTHGIYSVVTVIEGEVSVTPSEAGPR
jgi:hypothetical protein